MFIIPAINCQNCFIQCWNLNVSQRRALSIFHSTRLAVSLSLMSSYVFFSFIIPVSNHVKKEEATASIIERKWNSNDPTWIFSLSSPLECFFAETYTTCSVIVGKRILSFIIYSFSVMTVTQSPSSFISISFRALMSFEVFLSNNSARTSTVTFFVARRSHSVNFSTRFFHPPSSSTFNYTVYIAIIK